MSLLSRAFPELWGERLLQRFHGSFTFPAACWAQSWRSSVPLLPVKSLAVKSSAIWSPNLRISVVISVPKQLDLHLCCVTVIVNKSNLHAIGSQVPLGSFSFFESSPGLFKFGLYPEAALRTGFLQRLLAPDPLPAMTSRWGWEWWRLFSLCKWVWFNNYLPKCP